ncbi:carbohydrate ABC transporter permease [Mesorhizobium sp. ANAO-SY3R2]|uniref:carbohydrate ABC transporter permease n=1 Tax=Mesorhizobium sp. ANAO-SY3R2 TaxID=3166644 RepID=UPI00367237DF
MAALTKSGPIQGKPGQDGILPYLLLAPALLLLGLLTLAPLVYSILMSLFEAKLGHGMGSFVGLGNFFAVLAEARFWNAALNTLVWVAASVAAELFLGVLLAVLLNNLLFGKVFFRAALFFPWVMPVAVIAFLWRWIYNPQNGILNVTLRSFGIGLSEPPMWLADADTAMLSALIVNAWRGTPFVLVMLLAALQGIPRDEYEAARVSGAGPLREFWYVTLPNLRTIILILVVLRTMQIANNFSLMWLLTGGGPAEATETLPILIYLKGFGAHDFGQASAVAVVLLLSLLGLAFAYLRLLQERE